MGVEVVNLSAASRLDRASARRAEPLGRAAARAGRRDTSTQAAAEGLRRELPLPLLWRRVHRRVCATRRRRSASNGATPSGTTRICPRGSPGSRPDLLLRRPRPALRAAMEAAVRRVSHRRVAARRAVRSGRHRGVLGHVRPRLRQRSSDARSPSQRALSAGLSRPGACTTARRRPDRYDVGFIGGANPTRERLLAGARRAWPARLRRRRSVAETQPCGGCRSSPNISARARGGALSRHEDRRQRVSRSTSLQQCRRDGHLA